MGDRKKWVITAIILMVAVGSIWTSRSVWFTDNERKIVAMGDSLTFGIGDKSGHGYVENLEQWLDRQTPDKNTVVNNYAVPGQQSDGLLTQLNENNIQMSIQKADYILLFIGMNDLVKSNGGDLAPLKQQRIALGKKDYENNLYSILNRIRKINNEAPVLFVGLYNPYPDNRAMDQIITEWNHTSQKIIKDYKSVTFIKTQDLFNEKTTKYFSDALHLNEKGYEKLTVRIIKGYDFLK